MRRRVRWLCGSSVVLLLPGALAAQERPCLRLNAPWWQLGMMRVAEQSGDGARRISANNEAHVIDRRTLSAEPNGYRLLVERTTLGLVDTPVQVTVRYTAAGRVREITGDTLVVGKSFPSLLMAPCSRLTAGQSLGADVIAPDTTRTRAQQSVTLYSPSAPLVVGNPLDTLGQILVPVLARRGVDDTTRLVVVRVRPATATAPAAVQDTVRPWAFTKGEEIDRSLIRRSDGLVIFRERTRLMSGRGWGPQHPDGDVVTVQAYRTQQERAVDSAAAALVLRLPRRGDLMVTMVGRDTTVMHYREWRGDTLIVRQFRRSGWRDELRTVWRDSTLVSASLMEPGTANQPAGPFYRRFRITGRTLTDDAAKDSTTSLPSHPWAIAIDGFEDVITLAMVGIPADSVPHPFSLYALGVRSGSWLPVTVSILQRGTLRVARLYNAEQRWMGTLVSSPTGELLASVWNNGQGVTRIPAAGTRLGALLAASASKIGKEDLTPGMVKP
jgi:hypothetical protein